MFSLSLVLFLFLFSLEADNKPQVQLTTPQMADCVIFGFTFQILTVKGKEIGCVASYDDLGNGFAAIQSCEIKHDREPEQSDSIPACTTHWQIVNLQTTETKVLEAPDFNHYFSSPSFSGEYVAYWTFKKDPKGPNDESFLVYAMVFDWRKRQIVRRELLGTELLATDNPYYFVPAQWVEEDGKLYVRFDFSHKIHSFEVRK